MPASQTFSRRDFLKFLALAPGVLAARPLIPLLDPMNRAEVPNILLFVFDAWSAEHMSMFGYPRQTMPNLERFAERTHVYHNHYSTGSFTVPGTASLLTGLHPWNHRAMHLGAGGVIGPHRRHDLFTVFNESHLTCGYSQNPFADMFLHQFGESLDIHIPNGQFSLERHQLYNLPVIGNDAQIAFATFDNNIFAKKRGLDGSLFVELLYRLGVMRRQNSLRKNYKWLYPRGMPVSNEYFLLDQTIDGSIDFLRELDSPMLAYFHFYPPHEPYTPSAPHASLFTDGWQPPEKPFHPLSQMKASRKDQLLARLRYDQYLASWDAEVARLLEFLETSGLLDTSIVIFTSDHGELFERGEIAHNTLLLSEPVAHIPLFISMPGQRQRKDIRAITSSVDILPTLSHLAGAPIPAWAEGRLLPGLGGAEDEGRSIYAMDAKMQSAFAPFSKFSISLIREGYKLVYYQYPEYSNYEFFDIVNDPEETIDIFPQSPQMAMEMKRELMAKVAEIGS